jgi:hypothetical protein
MKYLLIPVVALVALLGPSSEAASQPGVRRLTAITATSAPVFVLPDATRTPLRMLTPGTRLRVLRDQGEWLRVEFDDPRWGPRVGYIERKHVEMAEPEAATPPPTRRADPSRPAPAPPRQRAPARFQRVWVDANVGVEWAGEQDYSVVATRLINGQDATFQADYHLPVDVMFDLGGGVLVTRTIGLGVSFASSRHDDPALLAIDIPHPVLTAPNATDSDTSDRSLRRSEATLHIHGAYVTPRRDQLEMRVYGGPSYFRIQQDAIEDIRYTQQFLPFDPVNEVDITGEAVSRIPYDEATGWGFHAGVDIGWFYTPALGLGFAGRYSRGQVEVLDPLGGDRVDLVVGGFQLGAGVRVRF